MSDAAFDVIEKELKDAGSKVIEQVGSKRKDFDFPHPTPLKSLAKFQTESEKGVTNYREAEFSTWLSKREASVNAKFEYMYYTPKFDGSSVNIVYRDGKLESVLTRGDGKVGKDISDRFRKHLPASFPIPEHTTEIIEIRCECVMLKSTFQKKYAAEFANARNIVAGILGKDDYSVEKVGDLTLVPLLFLINGKPQEIHYLDELTYDYPIFGHTHSTKIRATVKDYMSSVKYMEGLRENFEFQLDGIVFALPVEFREQLGENDHDPEWAIAIKFVPEEAVTPVIGIEWNLGKTGELTPVVKLKPVQLAGTSVKRASGYNAGYILRNKITEGTFVSICKRGDIIPAIQKIISLDGTSFTPLSPE
jgi:DNA ligase (NAD+)